jgi:hypothetical protein
MQITTDLTPAHALHRFMRWINEADVLGVMPVDQARVFEVASDALRAELTDALAKKWKGGDARGNPHRMRV